MMTVNVRPAPLGGMGYGGTGLGLMALSPQQVRKVYDAVARLVKAFKDAKSGKWVVPPTQDMEKITERVSARLFPGEPPPPPPPEPETT